jgi:dienelactone hydrolase
MATRILIAVAVFLSHVVGGFSDDVAWLNDVNTAPRIPSVEGLGTVAPLLQSESGEVIKNLPEWKKQRAVIRDQWLKFLGPMPARPSSVKLEVLKEEKLPGVIRQLVRYEGEPGTFVEGYLLLPQQESTATKLPGIVALHPTTNETIDEIAGVSGRDGRHTGLQLANRGFVVFCPRCFLWQDVTSLDEAVSRHRARHPESLGMAKMLYDAMRAVDVLESLPSVDRNRLGAIGHSLGAKEVLYLAAFDDRIRAGVASEGGIGFRSTNWDAPWYLGEAIRDEAFPLNHHQLLAFIAPRPFLVLGGESGPGAADGDRSWPLIAESQHVWKLYGEPVRLGLLNHHEGHSVSPMTFERMAEWLETYLQNAGN